MIHYGSKSFWDFAQADDSGDDSKLQCVFDLLAALGLRNPTEPCLKYMTSLWMMLTNSGDVLRLSSTDELVDLATVKDRWTKFKHRLDEPPIYLEVPPELPHQFQSKFPAIWAAVFTQTVGLPIACPIAHHTLRTLDASYGCRGGLAKVRNCESLAVVPSHHQHFQQHQEQCRTSGFESLVSDSCRMQSKLIETQMLKGRDLAHVHPYS